MAHECTTLCLLRAESTCLQPMGAACTSERDVQPEPTPAPDAPPEPDTRLHVVVCIDRKDPSSGALVEYFPPTLSGQLAEDVVAFSGDSSLNPWTRWFDLLDLLTARRWTQQQAVSASQSESAPTAPVATSAPPKFGANDAPFFFGFGERCKHIITGRTAADALWIAPIFEAAFPDRQIGRM